MWAIRPTRGGTMLVGIVFFALCVFVAAIVAARIENRFPNVAIVVAVTIAFGIPIAAINYFEFPTLFGKPTVATFDEDDNLVYHKWGLYTPSGLEVVNAVQGQECRFVGGYDGTIVFVENNGWIHKVVLGATLILDNPKTFYATRSRRHQSADVCLLKGDLEGSLVTLIAREGTGLSKFCVEDPPLNNDGSLNEIPGRCAELGKFLENKLRQRYEREGVSIKITTRTWDFWRAK